MYILDTNTCIYIMKLHPPTVQERLRRIPPREVAISNIVLAELGCGISKSAQRHRNEVALSDFLSRCEVYDWPSQAAPVCENVRVILQTQGRVIGGNDLLIASHAVLKSSTFVTNNIREFERVPNLKVQNWV